MTGSEIFFGLGLVFMLVGAFLNERAKRLVAAAQRLLEQVLKETR